MQVQNRMSRITGSGGGLFTCVPYFLIFWHAERISNRVFRGIEAPGLFRTTYIACDSMSDCGPGFLLFAVRILVAYQRECHPIVESGLQ